MATRGTALAAGGLVALVLAACGGPSREDFVRKADAACRKETPPRLRPPRNRAEAERYARAQLRFRRRLNVRFGQAGEPPDELKEPVARIERLNRRVVELLERQVRAARANRERRYSRIGVLLRRAFVERERLADRIGFEVCAQPTRPGEG